MITVHLKIGEGGEKVDTQTFGLVYLDSDKRVGPESKGFEATSYPEEPGEHIIPKSVDAPFDYIVKFFIKADSKENANEKIAAFNKELYVYEEEESDVKTYKQVTFYNDYKRHKIVGYPSEIASASEFWQDRKNQLNDIIVVEWKIRVTDPRLCRYDSAD